MACYFRRMKRDFLVSFLWCWVPSVFLLVFDSTASLAVRHSAHQKHTVLDITAHKSSLSSALSVKTVAAASARANSSNSGPSWLCRISKGFAACGSREYNGIYPPIKNVYCPEKFCCSKTACLGGCGSWCHDNWALCSSSIVYHPEYSYGNCNCKRFGHQCHENAECVHQNQDDGGVYCQCRTGFTGDGLNCVTDYCAGDACYPGECKNLQDGNTCTCPDTHMVAIVNNRQVCQEKPNYCLAEPCGPQHMVKECKNTGTGYECTCQQGYTVRNNRCEEVDLCLNSPCGPSDGVHSCVTERQPKFRYRCQCKSGYDLQLLANGESEICKKNWCYGDPCGSRDRVEDCHSTEDGYSCLCKDTYTVETDTEGREKCVKDDVCKQAPCGPPAIAKRCYAEGAGYRCECQPGYAEFDINGRKTCVEGDPCSLEACGSQEKVAECTTDGSNYTCTCREPDFLLGLQDGQKTCLSKAGCTTNCGPLDAVQTCAINNGVYACKCNVGYMISYRDGKKMCQEQDACAVNPCGSEKAVEKCTPNPGSTSSPYTCTCKEDYEVRTLEDQSEVCAEAGSCVGNPCGPSDIVTACITEENTYSCHCVEGYAQVTVNGKKRCALAAGTRQKYESASGTESQGMSNTAIAGSILGGFICLGAVGGGIAYARRKHEEEEDEGEEPAQDDQARLLSGEEPVPSGPPRAAPVYMGLTPGV